MKSGPGAAVEMMPDKHWLRDANSTHRKAPLSGTTGAQGQREGCPHPDRGLLGNKKSSSQCTPDGKMAKRQMTDKSHRETQERSATDRWWNWVFSLLLLLCLLSTFYMISMYTFYDGNSLST